MNMGLIKMLLFMFILGIVVYNLLINRKFIDRNCHFIIKLLIDFIVVVFIVVVFIYYGFFVPDEYDPDPF
jgi:hypothetical protein